MRPLVPAKNGLLVPTTILLDCGRQPCDTTYNPPSPPPPPPPQPGPDDRRRNGPFWNIATMTASDNVTVAGEVHEVTMAAVLHPAINPASVSTVQSLTGRGFRMVEQAGAPPIEIPLDEPWVTLTFTATATLGFDITNATQGQNFTYTVPMPPYGWQDRGAPLDDTTFEVIGAAASRPLRPTRLPAGVHEIKVFAGIEAFTAVNIFFGLWDLTE